MINYSPKFWGALGYIQHRLRVRGEQLSYELLEECIDEIRKERDAALAPETRASSPRESALDCGDNGAWLDLCDDGGLGDDSASSASTT